MVFVAKVLQTAINLEKVIIYKTSYLTLDQKLILYDQTRVYLFQSTQKQACQAPGFLVNIFIALYNTKPADRWTR